ncbi:MAG: isoaspartyl peptidase/L-asparaginase [Thermoanaerobaculales bacterium]|nr:isoaspartyl peptidase/L-asparaginase [Thermoanaerobaculales bacterium]
MHFSRFATVFLLLFLTLSCGEAPQSPEWALVIHGGAGVISRDQLAESRQEYVDGLRSALATGQRILAAGGTSLDAVESVLAAMEDNPLFNAGKGAVYNWDGGHELDASIMNGADHACGAVAGVTTVKNPIRLARLVMERSRHVLFGADGAEAFADAMEMDRVDPTYFDTERRRESWENFREDQEKHGTVGCVALDVSGNLAAGTSTGGLTGKRFGRVGDSPIIGAGTWADNRTCAVSGTGVGEEFIRHGVAQRIADLMEYAGLGVTEAAEKVVHGILQEGDGGVIVLDAKGNAAMVYNTNGMFRGRASSDGLLEVLIWDEVEE